MDQVVFLIWWLTLFGGVYHAAFQLCALLRRPEAVRSAAGSYKNKIAILYITRDDFNWDNCFSCSCQTYVDKQIYICDDSQTEKYKNQIDAFLREYPFCKIVRRENLQGFKAGNLNHAFENALQERWALLVDADQYLPENYLEDIVKYIPGKADDVAFIQAAHEPKYFSASPFQKALGPEVEMFYRLSLPARARFGFMPMLGHGVLVQKSVWYQVGRFSEIVSEDFAFAISAAMKNKRGIYVENIKSFEECPYDFGGFMLRLKKWAGGTAELIRWRLNQPGNLSFVENYDFMMQIFGYIMAPLIFVNLFIGAFVLHSLKTVNGFYGNLIISSFYSFLFFFTICIILYVSKNIRQAIRFYFWSTAVYSASLPIIGIKFLKHLFVAPSFKRTPKNETHTPVRLLDCVLMVCLGFITLVAALYWFSSYSYVLLGVGCAYLSYPFLGCLSHPSLCGRVSRLVVYSPGSFFLYALCAMWSNMYR